MSASPTPRLGLVLDCLDPVTLAPFWAAALDYTVLGEVENYVLLVPNGREAPKLLLQRVGEGKLTKNRMHLDIETSGVEDEVARLVALGAKRAEPGLLSEHGNTWAVLTDPEGNEFCVCDGGQPSS